MRHRNKNNIETEGSDRILLDTVEERAGELGNRTEEIISYKCAHSESRQGEAWDRERVSSKTSGELGEVIFNGIY